MSTDDSTTSVEHRPTARYPGYWVGDDGTLWCAHKTHRRPNLAGVWIEAAGAFCRRVVGTITKHGYVRVMIQRGPGDPAMRFIHDLVLEAFVGPCPDGMECRHWDGCGTNNLLANLLWGTPIQNAADRKRHGTDPSRVGSHNGNSDLDEPRVAEIKQFLVDGLKNVVVARMFGVRPLVIHKIRAGTAWGHVAWPGGIAPEVGPHAKLTKPLADEIRRLSAEGATGADLARLHGVCPQTICNILKGRIFKDAPILMLDP